MTHAGRIRIVVFGLGTVGRAIVELATTRPWLELVGSVVHRQEARELDGVPVSTDADSLLDATSPDVALIATRPTVAEVLPDVERCVRRKIAVLCTSEELAFPEVAAPGSAGKLDAKAREAGVAVASAGINPGFIFDAIPLAIAGAAWDIARIHVTRALDASVFGREVHRSLGVGYDIEDFTAAVDAKRIRGHIGFEESAHLIAGTMGREIEHFEERLEPIVAKGRHELRDHTIEPGQTAGVTQRATARVAGEEWLQFDLLLHVAPDSIGMETRDHIRIEGRNTLDVSFRPGTQAVLTTAARMVNSIPALLDAAPGFHSAVDFLPAAPWLGSRSPGS